MNLYNYLETNPIQRGGSPLVVNIVGDTNVAQLLVGVSPLRQLHRISASNEAAQPYCILPQGWKLPTSLEAVGIKDFIFCPQCINTKEIPSPPNYHMFVLIKPNSLNGIVLIRHDYIQELDRSFSHAPSADNPYRLYETRTIRNRLAMFYQEAKTDYPGRNILLHDLAQIITTLLLRGISKPVVIQTIKRTFKDIGLAIDYINNNYYKKITLKELALQVNYSQYHFIRIFQKETGKTPFEYLTDIRVAKAREFLITTNLSITEICLQCGFQNSSLFANFFKLNTGMSPSEFRQSSSNN